MNDLDFAGLIESRNGKKLLRGLIARGVKIDPIANGHGIVGLYICQNHGQGMMNKAHGEIAPTWELLANPLYFKNRPSEGEAIEVEWDEERVKGVASYIPLSHIVSKSSSEWEISITDEHLEIGTGDVPPHWN